LTSSQSGINYKIGLQDEQNHLFKQASPIFQVTVSNSENYLI